MTILHRLGAALPPVGFAMAGSLAWASALAASACAALFLRGWSDWTGIVPILAVFFAGGLLAFVPAAALTHLIGARRAQPAFAAAFLSLATLTAGASAFVSGLAFRAYFAQWHAPITTKLGLNEFIFTIASGIYQFLVLGLRLMFPFGLAALVVAAVFLMRWPQAKRLNGEDDSG